MKENIEIYFKIKKLLFVAFLIVSSVSLTSIASKDIVFKRNQSEESKVPEKTDLKNLPFDKSWGTN